MDDEADDGLEVGDSVVDEREDGDGVATTAVGVVGPPVDEEEVDGEGDRDEGKLACDVDREVIVTEEKVGVSVGEALLAVDGVAEDAGEDGEMVANWQLPTPVVGSW